MKIEEGMEIEEGEGEGEEEMVDGGGKIEQAEVYYYKD